MATAQTDEERTNGNGQKDEGEQRGRVEEEEDDEEQRSPEEELAHKIEEVRMTSTEERPGQIRLHNNKRMKTLISRTNKSFKTRHKGRKAFGHFHFFYGLQRGVKMHIVPLAIPVFV